LQEKKSSTTSNACSGYISDSRSYLTLSNDFCLRCETSAGIKTIATASVTFSPKAETRDITVVSSGKDNPFVRFIN
jgi:hypothetical protein